MNKIEKIYHPYYLWEEVKNNMWGDYNKSKKEDIENCIEFMNNIELFSHCMDRVINNWKYSCEHNLTKRNTNRVAWLGQASCAFYLKVPEDVVRASWKEIPLETKEYMNSKAKEFILHWENNVFKK